MKSLYLLVVVVTFLWSFVATLPDVPDLYFSNISNIQYYNETSSNTQVVFDNLHYGEALECNQCDHKIYWIDLPGEIRRGNPNHPSTIETIISSDLHNPHGLAVDWISNNVYFSHIRAENHGRIEVAKCDGSHRKVLKYNLRRVGVLAVNPITGHLYYNHDLMMISRIHLDGGGTEENIVNQFIFHEVSGIAVDHHLNILYWAINNTDSNILKYINMTEWDLVNSGRDNSPLPEPVEISALSNPYEIVIINSTLYWTELRTFTEGTVVRPGAIYSKKREEDGITMLFQSPDLSPHDLCSFSGDVQVPTSGCAIDNGGCEIFCFSVPNNEGEGTRAQCGCPTGIIINPNNSTCNAFPDNYLILTQVHNSENNFEIDRTDIRMISLDISGQFIDVLIPIELTGTETVFIAYDLLYHRVYWTELNPPSIRSAFIIDGSDVRVFINSSISHPESLVIDSYARNLYWIDSGLDRIEVVSLSNSRTRKVLFNSELSQPQGLALDVFNGYMYWTDLNSHTPRVERSRMDGTDRMELPGVNGANIKQPSNVAVDPLTRQVYWSDVFDGKEKIVRYDGVQEYNLFITDLRDVLGLAVHGSHIYWTDRGNVQQPLARANKNSGEHQLSLVTNVGGFHGLVAVNQSTEPVASSGCAHIQLSKNQLCLPSGDSEPNITCSDFFILNNITRKCEDTPAVFLIATAERIVQLQPFDDDGSDGWRDTLPDLDISGATVLDVDVMENRIYWINKAEKRIYRQSISVSQSDALECVVCCCLGSPDDLAVDWYGRNLYWTDSELRIIEISKLDGSERSIFAIIPQDLGAPSIISVDPVRGNLYWSPKSGAIVYQIRMDDLTDDSNPKIKTLWQDPSLSWSNLTIGGIALSYSTTDDSYDYVYWAVTDEQGQETTLHKKKLDGLEDGGNVEESYTIHVAVFDVETFGGSVYYHRIIHMIDNIINAHTNNHVPPILYNTKFNDFVIMHHSLQPGIHECSVNNRGCGGNSFCLVADGVSGVCSCPTLLATKISLHPLSGNTFYDCIAVDTFLLLATNDSISYLPVPVDGSSATASPRYLSLGSVGNIRTIAYDPANKSVLWIEKDNLQSVAVDGSQRWEFSVPSGLDTFSLAYDWFGGQVFITETNGFQIELLTLNGENIGSLLKLENNPLSLKKPGELVLDDINSYLYWTSRSVVDGYGEAIYGMSLMNVNDVRRLNIGNRKIEKLVHDSTFLYWINRDNKDDIVIERYNLSNPNSDPSVIVHFANSVTALTATTINFTSNVFWYNETDKFIYRYNGSMIVKYMMWRAPGTVVSILGYTRKDLLQARPCLASSRPCSHLCLRDVVNHYQCGCPPYSDSLINGSNCSGRRCDSLQLSCGDGFDGCYPRSYRCDGIRHCRNGEDEENCSCDIMQEYTCFNTTNECIRLSQRCDGTINCREGEDEKFCCEESSFGCYVNASDVFDPFGGTGDLQHYACLDMQARCDSMQDCVDGSDEKDCPTSPTSDTPRRNNDPLQGNTLIVIIVAVVVIIIMVVLLVGVCITVRWVHKKKQEYYMNQTMIRANNMSMGGCKGNSPPLRSESQSDYCSEMSGGTHTTQLGNGSNMSPSGDTPFKYRTADPPPPSPDALTEIEDDLSRISQPISEYTVPVPPCPSINYDALSGNMSFSVSQSQFPGTITSHYHEMYNQRVGVNGRTVGNLPNPLLMHQQNGSAYYHSNRAPQPQHICPHLSKNTCMPNGSRKYDDRHYPPAPHYRQNVHSRKELDSLAQSETESTLSMNIENPPDVFDENLPRTPPGRPPSPATLCSGYPGPQLMSPETESTLSESSDDC